jgi:iron(III) transport system ATP-binding protein
MSVKLVGVTKIFEGHQGGAPVAAVRDFSLDVAEGEFVTLLGPSGCGKTTTLRIVAGFERPSSGEILLGGVKVNDLPPNKRDTTMVFQSYAIFPHMSVEQNIGFGLELKGRPKAEIRREVARVMEVMSLGELARRRPDQLSGGQQQRVALARAIVNQPKVFLFDEPLSNLDAKLREQMRLEIRRIQQTFGITSIYVTHDQAEAMTVSDRIAVMESGLAMQIGTPFEIYSRPANRFVADFIGRANFIAGRVVRIDGGTWVLETAKGELCADSKAAGLEIGAAAELVVRPESLALARLDGDGEAAGGDAAAIVDRLSATGAQSPQRLGTGKVSKAVYLGPTVEYEIETGFGRPLLAVSHDPVDAGFFRIGESVAVDFTARAAHLIPAG